MNMLLSVLLVAAAADAAAEQRARDVLAQAREVLGGKRAAAVRSLSLEAELRRVQPVEGGETRDISGELTIDAQLPDRYLKVETLSPFAGAPAFSIGTGLDGQEAWRAQLGGGGGPHMVIRVAGALGPGAAEALLRRTRAELTRFLLAALAAAPADMTLVHAGEAEAPEGRAERIEVGDAQGPIGTLFVDKASHRPLLLSFRAPVARMQVMRAASHGDAERTRASAEPRPAAPAPEADARLFVSDWRLVDGLLLPHRVSLAVEGGASEEWTIKKWRLDAPFKPSHFQKQ